MFVGAPGRGWVVCALALAAAACSDRPSDATLDAWRAEAVAANNKAVAANKSKNLPWKLTVLGRIKRDSPVVLPWATLSKLSVTSIRTRSPQNPANPEARVHFRGVRVGDVLERVGVEPGVEEITFAAYDAFRSTIKLRDAEKYPIVLAIEADGEPIPRSSGGPIFLTFPHDSFPETKKKYPDRYWSFYVTHMVVGTPEARLNIAGTAFDAAKLATLPQHVVNQRVRYKVHWPSNAVRLRGVKVRDLFAAAGVKLASGDAIRVVGLAPIHRDPKRPLTIAVADLDRCGVFVATHWGAADLPIPARLGGPLALAFAESCRDDYSAKRWVTMLRELHVVRRSKP